MFVSLSVAKILEKHIRSSSTYYRSFSIKIRIQRENLLNGYFYYSSFIWNLLNRYFYELLLVAGERKLTKFINEN